MVKLWATVAKELLLLFRDRAGLLVLFLMPAALVVVISLVQENVMNATGETGIRVLFIDRDGEKVAQVIQEQMGRSDALQFVTAPETLTEKAAREALTDGDYQFCIILPQGLTEALRERVTRQIQAAFGRKETEGTGEETADPPTLTVYFDPLVQGAFRGAVVNALQGIVLALEMEMKARAFSEAVPRQADQILAALMGPTYPQGAFPRIDPGWGRERLLEIESLQASRGGFEKLPSSVQQNVPAWALFGIFFIVVPMGGSLIRERQEGTLTRLMTLPVSYGVLLLGKVLAYVLVCLCQFWIIVLMGFYVLPLLGTPVLEMGSAYGAIFLVVVSAALAAAGYGILLGAFARTYEQASMFGPVSVVIAAAVGGIMVPVYAMPEMMREISRFSPLAWGLNGLTDLFVRQGDIRSVWPEVLLLLAFAAATMITGWWRFVYRERTDL
ncbi:MAG: ABC transporter permease [Desulfococcaceae bacterium]